MKRGEEPQEHFKMVLLIICILGPISLGLGSVTYMISHFWFDVGVSWKNWLLCYIPFGAIFLWFSFGALTLAGDKRMGPSLAGTMVLAISAWLMLFLV